MFLAIAAIVAAGVEIYGQVSAANARADAESRQAQIQRLQAQELLDREGINEQLMRDQAGRASLEYGAFQGSTGVEGGGIGAILRLKSDTEQNIANARRDAEFKAKMILMGAQVNDQLASDTMTAGYLQAAGTALRTGASVYDMYRAPSNPQSLPKAKEF